MAWVLPAGDGPVVMARRWPAATPCFSWWRPFSFIPSGISDPALVLGGFLFNQYVVRAYCVPDMDQMLGPG